MPNFTGSIISGQPAFSSTSTAQHRIGQQAHAGDGRKYRYVYAGGAALVVGNALQAPAQNTGHDQLTPSAASIGAASITVTPDSGAITANQYSGGYAVIDTTPGLGYVYQIASHPSWSSGTLVLTLAPEDSVQVALTTDSRVTLVSNPYRNVIQCPQTTATNVPVGGAIYPITLNEYGWIQSGGPGSALIDGTPAVGQPVTNVASVAGSLAVHSAELPSVAHMLVTGVNTKVLPVFWLLD